ncbi:MFS transporter [Amycolatopsis palatopharyngis]|uniref:MFS transporter n=1 Tax=Amycolatopsis palatopharyngis TaxID=187982 RepID=UPI000E25C363|nr:MFS transporter [Amycolatopsis palatopharyngis]
MSAGLTEPLRHRNFRALTGGRTATELGNAIAPVALAFVVLDLTGSVVDLGIVVGARSVANVLLVLLGGMLADRLPRSFILQGTALLAALTQAGIAGSVLFGFATMPLLIVLSFVNGGAAAMSLPAAAALTPQTVPGELLTQANALVRIGANSGRITGLALGGVLVAAMGTGWTIAVNAALFLVASVSYRRVRLPVATRTEPARPLAELAEGWREFVARTWVWVVVAQFMVVNAVIAGCVAVLGPAIADETIGRGAWGFVLAAQTAGAFAGGFLAARWRPRHLLRIGVAVTAVEAVPLLTLAWAPAVIPLLVAMFTAGVAIEQFVVAWDVSLQENIPRDRLARVYSYDMLGSFVALPAGEIAAGPLAERFGAAVTLTGGAVLVVLTTGAALLCQDIRTLARTHQAPVP